MRLDDQNESSNVEDRRGGFSGVGRGGIGVGTLVVALAASYFFGIDPRIILGLASNVENHAPQASTARKPPPEDEMARFVSKILGSTETTWTQVFKENGVRYEEPRLVLPPEPLSPPRAIPRSGANRAEALSGGKQG